MPQSVGEYQLGNVLGKGAYGVVYKGLNLNNGEVVAIKQVSLENVQGVELDSVMGEIELLRRLQHENIVRYIDFVKTEDQLNIILEFAEDGALTRLFKKSGTVAEPVVRDYVRQMLAGLAYLHAQGVVHCDIKCANILKSRDGTIKLTDFGVSTTLKSEEEFKQDVVGTPYWMAPEIIQLEGATTASDIWSLGCTIIELLTGKPPYHDLRSMSALYRIVEDDRPPFPPGISAELSDFLLKIFQKNKSDRWTAVQLLLHQFVSKDNSKKTQHSDQPIPFFVPLAQQTKESLHTAFGLMDKDNKGMIATDQLKLLLRSLGGVWTEREMDARISKLNGANASFETFATIVKEMNALDIKEVKNAFAAVDDSKNGLMKLSDLKRLVINVGDKLSSEEYELIRAEMLVDEDGRFKYEDWIQSIQSSSSASLPSSSSSSSSSS